MGTKVIINGNKYALLKINGIEVPKIVKYQATAPKLWSSDTGRDMSGTNRGTLVGIFTKVQVETGVLTAQEYQALANELDKASLVVQYYDSGTGHILEESMYANDRGHEMLSAKKLTAKGLAFNLIANKKKKYARVIV